MNPSYTVPSIILPGPVPSPFPPCVGQVTYMHAGPVNQVAYVTGRPIRLISALRRPIRDSVGSCRYQLGAVIFYVNIVVSYILTPLLKLREINDVVHIYVIVKF